MHNNKKFILRGKEEEEKGERLDRATPVCVYTDGGASWADLAFIFLLSPLLPLQLTLVLYHVTENEERTSASVDWACPSPSIQLRLLRLVVLRFFLAN